MAAFNEPQQTPNVGIRGNPESQVTLKKSESLVGPSSTPAFTNAFIELANVPNAITQFGMELGKNASDSLMDKWAIESGKNPHGNLLPAITDADKRYSQSYSNQASVSLGLNGQALVANANDEISKLNKITPEAILSYKQNIMEGLQNNLDLAPDNIRPHLENQFGQAVINNVSQLNTKMISQQKADAKDKQDVSNDTLIKGMYNDAFIGDKDAAYQGLQDFKEILKSQRESGTISRKEESANYDAAKMNFYSGVYSRGANDAKISEKIPKSLRNPNAESLPEYLRNMQSTMPDSLTPLEKISVSDQVLQYVQKIHNQEAQDNQLIVSQLNRALSESSLTQSMLTQAESTLDPTDYNNFMSKMWSYRNKQKTANNNIQFTAENFSNVDVMAQASDANKNAAYTALTAKAMQDNPDLTEFQAQTGVVKGGAAEIPAYTKHINGKLLAGGPEQVLEALEAIHSIQDYDKSENIIGVDKNGMAIANLFDEQIRAGVDATSSLISARELVLNKTKDQQEAMERKYVEYKKDNLNTDSQIEKHAKTLLGAANHWFSANDEVANLPLVANRLNAAWAVEFKRAGSASGADKAVSESVKRAYGESWVNGRKQITFLPVEKIAGVGQDATGIIHNDIHENLNVMLRDTVNAYKDKRIDYFFRSMPPVAGKPLQVEKVYRNTNQESIEGLPEHEGLVQTFNLSVTAGDTMLLSNNAQQPYVGSYDLGLTDAKGYPADFGLVSNGQSHFFQYKPDIKKIQLQRNEMRNNKTAQQHESIMKREAFIANAYNKSGEIKTNIDKFIEKQTNDEDKILSSLEGQQLALDTKAATPEVNIAKENKTTNEQSNEINVDDIVIDLPTDKANLKGTLESMNDLLNHRIINKFEQKSEIIALVRSLPNKPDMNGKSITRINHLLQRVFPQVEEKDYPVLLEYFMKMFPPVKGDR